MNARLRVAASLIPGDILMDDTSRKYRTVREVFRRDILSPVHVSPGMVHVRVSGSDTIWVMDSMAEVQVR